MIEEAVKGSHDKDYPALSKMWMNIGSLGYTLGWPRLG